MKQHCDVVIDACLSFMNLLDDHWYSQYAGMPLHVMGIYSSCVGACILMWACPYMSRAFQWSVGISTPPAGIFLPLFHAFRGSTGIYLLPYGNVYLDVGVLSYSCMHNEILAGIISS